MATYNNEIDLLTVAGIRNDVRDSFTRAMIASEEQTDVATAKRYAGDYIVLKSDRLLYRVTQEIPSGGTYTPGVNIERKSVADALRFLEDQSADSILAIVGNYEPTGKATKKYTAGDRIILPYGSKPGKGLYYKVTTTVNAGVTFTENINCTRELNPISSILKTIEDNKQDKPTVLTSILSGGSKTIAFTNAALTSTAVVDIYVDKYGYNPKTVTHSGSTLTLTFKEAQETNTTIKLVVLKGV